MTHTHSTAAHLPTDQPLVSGDEFIDDAGTSHALTSVSIVVTGRHGTSRRIELTRRGDGWWAPAPEG